MSILHANSFILFFSVLFLSVPFILLLFFCQSFQIKKNSEKIPRLCLPFQETEAGTMITVFYSYRASLFTAALLYLKCFDLKCFDLK